MLRLAATRKYSAGCSPAASLDLSHTLTRTSPLRCFNCCTPVHVSFGAFFLYIFLNTTRLTPSASQYILHTQRYILSSSDGAFGPLGNAAYFKSLESSLNPLITKGSFRKKTENTLLASSTPAAVPEGRINSRPRWCSTKSDAAPCVLALVAVKRGRQGYE